MYTISIDIEVRDKQALFDAALSHYIRENDYSADASREGHELLMCDGEINVEACLVQLADPGMSWPGTSILNSTAEGN